MKRAVALVEDDEVLRENYEDYLLARGFEVRAFANRATAATAFRARLPDVAILDVALGQERDGGLLLCSEIRRFSATLPVIFLTCHDNESDRILGLRVGGDDYLSKDSSLELLAVRIDTLLERHRAITAQEPPSKEQTLEVGPLSLDLERAQVTWRGTPIELSFTHYWIVLALASDLYRPKSPAELMDAANIRVAPNTIAAHIRAIRSKFHEADPEFEAIRTEHGHGYRWVV